MLHLVNYTLSGRLGGSKVAIFFFLTRGQSNKKYIYFFGIFKKNAQYFYAKYLNKVMKKVYETKAAQEDHKHWHSYSLGNCSFY